MAIHLEPIGIVRAARAQAEDDSWGGEEASIELTEEVSAEALQGPSDSPHAELLFLFLVPCIGLPRL